jgi:hypothetical protein
LNAIITDMGDIYGSAKVCPPTAKKNSEEGCFSLEPELTEIMANSRNYTERTYYWKVRQVC